MSINKDINGKESSKRLWATRLLTLGFLLAIFFVLVWTIALFFFDKEITIRSALVQIWSVLMAAGTGTILGTAFETPKPECKEDRFEHGYRRHQSQVQENDSRASR